MAHLHRKTSARRNEGFTLVELLVVIGIIAILIGILLPGLQQARRQANQVKCAASLKEVGNAFFLYAGDHKGAWPVSVHQITGAGVTKVPRIDVERRWSDLLAKYVTKAQIEKDADIDKIRAKSVLWGCPEWQRSEFNVFPSDKYRTGYAMNHYSDKFFSSKSLYDLAYIDSAGTRGSYLKTNQFARRSAEKGLVVDSMTHVMNIPSATTRDYNAAIANGWQPGPAGTESSLYTNGGKALYVDAGRHLKGSRAKDDKVRGMNMLFCDGHVTSVSVREAWEAMVSQKAQ